VSTLFGEDDLKPEEFLTNLHLFAKVFSYGGWRALTCVG
jgi:hypothetical protein